MSQATDKSSHIAVIGMGLRFPGANTPEAFWQNLRNGVESISFFSREELESPLPYPDVLEDARFVRARPIIDDADRFDAPFFGVTPRDAEIMDPQFRIFLECAWAALEDAGYDPTRYTDRVGVYGAAGRNTYLQRFVAADPELGRRTDDLEIRISNEKDYLATRVSYALNLRGPSISVQTACSSSLAAVAMACRGLANHDCGLALAGGVSILVPQKSGYLHTEGGILSRDGHCRAFDASATGTVFGNGGGIVVLKRLEEAVADGDYIRAVIRGVAMNNDGSGKDGYAAPSVTGQADVIADALARAEVDAGTIGFVEAHGTGTLRGDPVEVDALNRAYRVHTGATSYCALGTAKSNIGHIGMASGIAGLIKAVLTLEHREIPPSPRFSEPNPDIDFDRSPFFVNTRLRKWMVGDAPRRAGVNSYGIGGTNVHAVLEEAPVDVSRSHPDSGRTHLLPISARTPAALECAVQNLREHLLRHPDLPLGDVAHTLQQGRKAFRHRRAVICDGLEDAARELGEEEPRRILSGDADPDSPAVAFMFPGMGTQYPGMAGELYATCPDFREGFERCLVILETVAGLHLREVLLPDDRVCPDARRKLADTTYSQPALFVIEYALARWWMHRGVVASALIGHSVGEYAAACIAGVFSLEDALRLVAYRGQRVAALPSGAMLAAACAEDILLPLLGERLSLAAINGPRLCVASGPEDDIGLLERTLSCRDIACRRLDVSHAFHSSMMDPVVEDFTAMIGGMTLRPPDIPLISTVTGTWLAPKEAVEPSYWGRHMRKPVRFADGLDELTGAAQVLVEIGPGATLTTLARRRRRTSNAPPAFPTLPPEDETGSDAAFALTTLGRLWLSGVEVNWPELHAGETPRRVPLPTYPFERRRYWIDSPTDAIRGQRPDLPHGKRPDVADWFYVPSWKRSFLPQLPREGIPQSRWLIFEDGSGLGARIADRLRMDGTTATMVVSGPEFGHDGAHRFTIDPNAPRDYDRLLSELPAPSPGRLRIVHLWGLDIAAEEQHGFYSLLNLGAALARGGSPAQTELCVVACNTQAVASDDVLDPGKVSALGPCRVLPQESVVECCRSIDIEVPNAQAVPMDDLAGRVLAEALAGGAERVVAYRGAHRWVETAEPMRLDPVAGIPARLRQGGTYLVTGGLGGVGFLLASYLARELQARLIVIGRTALPDQETRAADTTERSDPIALKIARVAELKSLGAEVMTLAADVACADSMRQVLKTADMQFGGIHGVIHAAGILGPEAFRGIDGLCVSDCADQFRPKVQGLQVLEDLLRDRDLDFCLLTSSLSSMLGGIGYGAYAAANLYMDAFACEQNRTSRFPWISVNWDRWTIDKGAVPGAIAALDPSAEANQSGRWDSVGMTPAEGVETFKRILDVEIPRQVIVSTGDLEARRDHWVRLRHDGEEPPAPARHPRGEMPHAYVPPRTSGETMIVEIWEDLLGFDQVGAEDDFFELGGHSLMGVQFLNRLRKDHGVEMSLRSLFEHRTVTALAEHLDQRGETTRTNESGSLVESLSDASPEDRLALVRTHLRRIIARSLAMPPEELPEEEELISRGLRMVIPDLVTGARESLSFTLYAQDIVKRPSVAELASFIVSEMEPSPRQAKNVDAVAPTCPARMAALFAPEPEATRRMVFLLSCPRSGSTLMRIMLSAHSRLFCPGELGLLEATSLADWQHHPSATQRRRGLAAAFAELTGDDAGACEEAVDALVAESAPAAAVYRALQRGAHPGVLVDKTPDYAMDFEVMRRADSLFDDARYILLVRHPLAVIESFVRNGLDQRFPGTDNDPHIVAEDCWTTCNGNLLRLKSEHADGRILCVHYEDLVTESERTMKAVCRFLDEPFEDAVLSPYQHGRMLNSPGDANTRNRNRIDPTLARVSRVAVPPRPLRGLCRRVAAEWGYSVDDVPVVPGPGA